jgi:hypothetical protein
MKTILLARVSSKEQEEGQSIPVQVRRLSNIAADFFNRKLKEYKEREQEILRELQRYAVKDTNAHVTANTVLSLASRVRDIFESSEVDEKRQLLNFLFQNLELKEKKLSVTLREPFKMIKEAFLSGKRPRTCTHADTKLATP